MRRCLSHLLFWIAFAIPTATLAQVNQVRAGVWFTFGGGWATLDCTVCEGEGSGLAGDLALGGTLSENALLGLAASFWKSDVTHENPPGVITRGTQMVAAFTPVLRFYPRSGGRLFVAGGVGPGLVIDTSSKGHSGLAGRIGIGYDARIGQKTHVTPFLNTVWRSARSSPCRHTGATAATPLSRD